MTGKPGWAPLSDEELVELAGDGTCAHLSYVRAALELQVYRSALAELRRLVAKMPGGEDLQSREEDPPLERQLRCGWCFAALGPTRAAVEAHLVVCVCNPLVGRVASLTRALSSRGDLAHNWKLVGPAEADDPTEGETHRCEACGLERMSEWGTLPTFYRKTSTKWERVEDVGCLAHSVGARYRAASDDAGQLCAHPELELQGRNDCLSIVCTRCSKCWRDARPGVSGTPEGADREASLGVKDSSRDGSATIP